MSAKGRGDPEAHHVSRLRRVFPTRAPLAFLRRLAIGAAVAAMIFAFAAGIVLMAFGGVMILGAL